MSRGTGWRWSFVPRWLMDSELFLELDEATAGLLLRLYLVCDPHGRFPAGSRALQRLTGIFNPQLAEEVAKLAPVFVSLYTVEGLAYGQLAGYDQDAPADLLRKRGASVMPDPSQGQTKGRQGADEGQTKGRRGAEPVCIDKKDREEGEETNQKDQTDQSRSGAYLSGVLS